MKKEIRGEKGAVQKKKKSLLFVWKKRQIVLFLKIFVKDKKILSETLKKFVNPATKLMRWCPFNKRKNEKKKKKGKLCKN